MKYDIREAHSYKKTAEIKRKQLAQLLSTPVVPKGFSGKYPLTSDITDVTALQGQQKNEKAVDVMKNALENNSKGNRKMAKWLFKPRKANESNSKKVESNKFSKDKRRKGAGKKLKK